MVQTLEAIRGGGGSIKVGTTGKISALMSREIESIKTTSKAPPQSRTSVDEASSSGTTDVKSVKGAEAIKKIKNHGGRTNQIPMLAADNISLQGTPVRQKPVRKGVEIVDIKCGNPDKTWTNPIANRLKKLGFSKLSDSIG